MQLRYGAITPFSCIYMFFLPFFFFFLLQGLGRELAALPRTAAAAAAALQELMEC